MRYRFFIYCIVISLFALSIQSCQGQDPQHPVDTTHEQHVDADHSHDDHSHTSNHSDEMPSPFMVIPFVILLGMIAAGPVFFEHFWHKNYKWIAPCLGLITLLYYLFYLHDYGHPAHSLAEYVSFIALLAPLYIASGGILIQIDREGKPMANLALLLIGSIMANVIGTTGASMLLIRPFIRLNRDRLQPYHIVFFIFMVSNIGGALTPIGDPPLFLGFLKGVPFFWTVSKVFSQWVFGLAMLSLAFYYYDRKNKKDLDKVESQYSGKVILRGTKNFFWLGIIVGAVFLDPNLPGMEWLPHIEYHGSKFSFVRELIQLGAGVCSYVFANKRLLKSNEFTFEPILEVVFLFAGIFFAMMPALQLISAFASHPENTNLITSDSLYWATGILSSFLDNAPTYLNFLSAATGKLGYDMGTFQSVVDFTKDATGELYLQAISVSAVFFGAMTYIGNGPNFMVKSIAEERGVKMPSFFGYMIRYSLKVLLPILILTWVIFFVLF